MMTFRDLINKCRYKSVFNIIYKFHLSDKSQEAAYSADVSFLDAWNNLRKLKFSGDPSYEIHLKKAEEYIDVCLYSLKEKTYYALDFVAWEELIDLKVYNELDLTDAESLAHILWEITFWGFSSAQIQTEAEKLKKNV